MGSKTRKKGRTTDFDPYDDFDDMYDDAIDIRDLSRDFYSTERDDDYANDRVISARRRIERRGDMKKLYSQLNEWEEFGDSADW